MSSKADDAASLVAKHPGLVQSDNKKVISHQQRQSDDWYINTLMIEGCDAPFRYKRKKAYQCLKGARVNLSYYPSQEDLAGIPFEVMNVVRLRRS